MAFGVQVGVRWESSGLRWGRATVCVMALIDAALTVGCARGPSFRQYTAALRRAAGADALDCGVVLYGEPRGPAATCARDALSSEAAFWVVFQVLGIDSQIFQGLAYAPGRTSVELTWDSDVSGGYDLVPTRRIAKRPCPRPRLTDANDVSPIECGDPGTG